MKPYYKRMERIYILMSWHLTSNISNTHCKSTNFGSMESEQHFWFWSGEHLNTNSVTPTRLILSLHLSRVGSFVDNDWPFNLMTLELYMQYSQIYLKDRYKLITENRFNSMRIVLTLATIVHWGPCFSMVQCFLEIDLCRIFNDESLPLPIVNWTKLH